MVKPISRQQLRRGLELALMPDTTRVTGYVARELASRASAPIYIEGRIDRVLSGFSIVVKVVDAESGELVDTVQESVTSAETLIPALDEVGRTVRSRLGEREERVRATRPHLEVITPSYEAYRLFARADEAFQLVEYENALRLLREALQIDPDSASAMLARARVHWNRGERNSAFALWHEALSRPSRLTDVQSMTTKAILAHWERGDLRAALSLYDELTRQFGTGYNMRGNCLADLGRFEEAVESYRSVPMGPFGPLHSARINEFKALMKLGRFDEAREVANDIHGFGRQLVDLTFPLTFAHWGAAESLATGFVDDPTSTVRVRFQSSVALASVHAVRGEVATAVQYLRAEAPSSFWRRETHFAFWNLFQATQGRLVSDIAVADGYQDDWLLTGMHAAARGDLAKAHRILDQARATDAGHERSYVALLDAWIAVRDSRWADVVRLLEDTSNPDYLSRWLLSEALEREGRLRETAAVLTDIVSPTGVASGMLGKDAVARGIPFSFAHRRLVLIHAQLDQVEEARRHWQIFERNFTNPDPELSSMVDEARRALEDAETSS